MNTKAIIFDCFGVLTTDGWLRFREEYLQHDSAADDRAVELNRMSDAGLIGYRDFQEELAKLASISVDEVRQVMSKHARNDQLFEFIANDLKPSYSIGLLSNAAGDYAKDLFTPEQVALFDATLFSFEIGVVKPHAAMYETIAARLGVLPEECIFIDDRDGFVEGAKASGMRAFRYDNFADCRKQLQDMLN